MLRNYTFYHKYPVPQEYNELVGFILRKCKYLEKDLEHTEMVSTIGKIKCGHISKIRGEEWDWIFQR